MLSFLPPQYAIAAKLVFLAAFVALLFGSGYRYGYDRAKTKADLIAQKLEADGLKEMARLNAENKKKQDQQHLETQDAEIKYNTALAEINRLRNAGPVTIVKRMYDNTARKVCPKRLPENSDSIIHEDPSDTGGVELSEEAGRFLQEEALRADLIIRECNLFRKSTHDWAVAQRQ